MKAVCVALFALFAVASAGLLAGPAVYSAPVAVAHAPVLHAAPVLRAAPIAVAHAPVLHASPVLRAGPVLAAGPVAYGAHPVAYGGLGGVAYGGPLIG